MRVQRLYNPFLFLRFIAQGGVPTINAQPRQLPLIFEAAERPARGYCRRFQIEALIEPLSQIIEVNDRALTSTTVPEQAPSVFDQPSAVGNLARAL